MKDHDHDLLITVAADVKNLAKQLEKVDGTVRSIYSKLGSQISWTQFWGIIVLLVGLTAGCLAYNFHGDADAHATAYDNKGKIETVIRGGMQDD